MFKILILVLFVLNFAVSIEGESRIKGVVKTKNQEPLPGVLVKVDKGSLKTLSDEFGKYSLIVPEGSRNLIFSAEGFETRKVGINCVDGVESICDAILNFTTYNFNVTVTSGKREEKIQEVPSSVSVISSLQLEDAGIKHSGDVHRSIPNVGSYNFGSGFSYNSVRGITNMVSFSSAFGVYLDDVPLTGVTMVTNFVLNDLERVEVLRGPQGTLYGMNSSGGVMNIVTKQPGNEWERSVSISLGDYKNKGIKGYIRGPIIKDKLFFGFSGMYNKQDEGFFDNDGKNYGEVESSAIKGSLRFLPHEDFEISLTAFKTDSEGNERPWSPVDDDPFKIPGNLGVLNEVKLNTQSLKLKYTNPNFELVSITSRNDSSLDAVQNLDYSATGLVEMPYHDESTTWSQEIRIASRKEGTAKVKWIGGVYLYSSNSDFRDRRFFDLALMNPAMEPGIIVSRNQYESALEVRNFSLFGQFDYNVTSKLNFTFGLRYERDKRSLDLTRDDTFDFFTMGPVNFEFKDSKTWEAWSPKFSVNYQVNSRLLLYGSVARGAKAGGYSPTGVDTPEGARYNPEYIWTGELGFKSELFNKRVVFNLSAFMSKVTDMQVMTFNGQTVRAEYSNAGKADIMGLEVEIFARPTDRWELTCSIGLLDSDFKENIRVDRTGKEVDYSGNKPPLSPSYTINLVSSYRFSNGIYLRGDLFRTGSYYFDDKNINRNEGYFLVNGKIGYEMPFFDLYFYMNNIFNKTYYSFVSDYSMAPEGKIGVPGRPRTFGLEAVVRF